MESSGGSSSSSSSQGQAHSQNQAQLSSAEIACKLSISDSNSNSNSNTKSKSKSPSSSSNGNADANFGVCNGILKAGGSGNGNGVQRSKSFAFRAPSQVYCIDDFDRQKTLGVGSYSRVVRAKKKDTGKVYALKIMEKGFILKENKAQYVKLERVVLDQLDHAGIVKLYFTFQDQYNIYLGLESCDGGELFDQITRKGCLSEEEACFYAAEIIDVLEYLHKLGLVHRDIKPENVLLTTDGHVKLADFGSVKPMENTPIEIISATSNEKACSFVGTAAYVPPEVLDQGPVTIGNDLWALGCTLYQMLAASSPFKDASEWLTFQRIINRNFHFPDHFSPEAKDLINKLLDKDPSKRLGYGPNGYASLKNHPFFRGVDWDNVRGMPAPKLVPLVAADKDEDSDTDDWLSSQLIPETADDEMVPKDKETASSSAIPDNKPRFTSIDAFDSRWENFLGPGEAVVMVSMVKKMRKLYNKKRLQLILTDKPKLFYVDPVKMVLKGEIQWSNNSKELFVQVLNSSNFKLCTVKKTILFEDLKQQGWKWKEMIESLQRQ